MIRKDYHGNIHQVSAVSPLLSDRSIAVVGNPAAIVVKPSTKFPLSVIFNDTPANLVVKHSPTRFENT